MPAYKLRSGLAYSRRQMTVSASLKKICDCVVPAISSVCARAVCRSYALPISAIQLSLNLLVLLQANCGRAIPTCAKQSMPHCGNACTCSGTTLWGIEHYSIEQENGR